MQTKENSRPHLNPFFTRHFSVSNLSLKSVIFLCLFVFFSPSLSEAAEISPLQTFFPEVKTISTDKLQDNFFTLTLIDIRDQFEFDIVRISTSINLTFEDGSFAQSIAKLTGLRNDIRLIIIGNNYDDTRAFEAARIAKEKGIKNVSVYDAGVFSWLHAYPGKTNLMGESPAQLEKVIPQIRHQKHLISYQTFKRYAEAPNAIVVDIRDIYHRNDIPTLANIKNIAIESLLTAIGNRIWAEKKLLIVDEDGSRTRWLQLFLQASGYYNYHFLDGGVNTLPDKDLFLAADSYGEDISLDQKQLQLLLTELPDHENSLAGFCYILSSILENNLAFISPGMAAKELKMTVEQFRSLSLKLSATKHVRFVEIDDKFIYQVDPKIAWKGVMSGQTWNNSVKQYHFQSKE